MISREEAHLLALAKDGDGLAFANLVEPYRARLWSICLRITGSRHDAEDALQDALSAAWLHLRSFRGEARFGTWAYRIAANAATAVVRRRRELPTDALERVLQPDSTDFASAIATRDQVATALAQLPEQFREALVLREYGDFTYEEIAVHQGVPVQTVKSRLHRARQAVAAATVW